MLTQTEIERERYEARRKAQLDHNSFLKDARMEGRAEGKAEGLAEGRIDVIHLCERLLQRPETPTERLRRLSFDELTRLAEELQAQLIGQR